MMESLRQKCAYQVSYDETEQSDMWFQFIVDFVDNCMGNTTYGEECAYTYLKKNKIDVEDVKKCVDNSFIKGRDGSPTDNTILKEDAEWAQ